MYTSSAASAAIQDILRTTCASDSGLKLDLSFSPAAATLLAGAANVEAPVTESVTRALRLSNNTFLVLISRSTAEQHVTPPIAPVAAGEAAVSDGNLSLLDAALGDTVTVADSSGLPIDLHITQHFDDIHVQPEPSFWCGDSQRLRPNGQGDPPPTWLLVDPSVHSRFAARPPFPPPSKSWAEFRLEQHAYTLHEVRQIDAEFQGAIAEYSALQAPPPGAVSTELPTLIARATRMADEVHTAVAGVRLAGLAAALFVLFAAAVMLARERRRELRLLALHGEPPWRITLRLVLPVAPAMVLGAVAGWAVTLLAVRSFGPAPQIEAGALRSAAVAAAVAVLVATVLAAGVAAVAGDRFVDAGRRRRAWNLVPFEVLALGVLWISYHRLTHDGTHVRSDVLALSFPLLALLTVVTLLWRPARWLLQRLRTSGSGWPRGVRLGWRRVLLDPLATTVVLAATFLAVGCFVTSVVLSASAERQLADKALTFVGADESIDVLDPIPVPEWLVGTATMTARIDGTVDGTPVDVLGVDSAELANAATLRGDAAGRSLNELVAGLGPAGPDGSLPALLVTAPSDWTAIDVRTAGESTPLHLHRVATANFFPGARNQRPLLVVNRAELIARRPYATHTLWLRDPPADAVTRLRTEGVRAGAVVSAADVFDSTDNQVERWSLDPLAALVVLFASVAAAVQLLAVEGRRDARAAAHVLMRRTGFTRRQLWTAALVEVAVPLWIAGTLAAAGAVAIAHASVRHLDSLPLLLPPAAVVVPLLPLAELFAALAVANVALAALIVRSVTGADSLKVLRGTV
ncbi:MAG: hypothetical protein RJA49_2161 [Actinomycetota bacterium]